MVPSHGEPQKLCGSMKAWQVWVKNYTNCVNVEKLHKSVWDQELGKIHCVFHIMRWCWQVPKCSLHFPYHRISKYTCSHLMLSFSLFSLHLYLSPAGFPLPIRIVVLVRKKCSPYNVLQISKFSESASPGFLPFTLKYRLRPDWLCVYIYQD